MRSIEQLYSASTYLRKLSNDSSFDVPLDAANVLSRLEQTCEKLSHYSFDDCCDANAQALGDAESILLNAKTDFAFAWCLAELSELAPQPELGRWQTRFAEVSIDFGLRLAWLSIAAKHKVIQNIIYESAGQVSGLFVFGMGKLGGNDLNFSSDVDLVAYFEPTVLPVPEMLGKSYVCHQVLQKLTQLLGQNGASNFVWRVDWRLRPNASATSLAMSTLAAEEYYFYRASPWHRLALMKARVVAGDQSLGSQFMDTITPFIWRQNLDYRALDELAEIKQRINLEHPSLRVQRQWTEPIGVDIVGFNVKLGSGGIREIEFIANALQLIWGGRVYELRTPNTVQALEALSKHGHLTKDAAQRLVESYQALRRIENAIQILGNQQTHLIPQSDSQQRNLLVLLGHQTWNDLLEPLNASRHFVHQTFVELFAEQVASQGEVAHWPPKLNAQADEVVQMWEDGYQAYGVSIQIRHRLLPLTQAIASYLESANTEPVNDLSSDASQIIIRLHEFFKSLPAGEQYFRLLAETPELLESIVPPLLHSPPMALLLRQSPHIIDCYVQADWHYPAPFESGYVMLAEQYEARLERLRRFVNEHLYQLYLEFLQGVIDVDRFQKALTDLAEHTLELALKIVAEHLELERIPIAVIGMGKVALRRMSPLSDLDLIFVYDADSTSLELASRFVSRLQTAISTPMREGIVYELDTRLRPSGRSGAPTVSVESFENHHRQRAHTWEHIALMPSRVVAGDKTVIARFDAIKRQVVNRPREQPMFLRDALKMWLRITEHRVDEVAIEIMNSKLRTGGLMQSEYLAACLMLQHPALSSNAAFETNSVDFDDLLEECVADTSMAELPNIIQFWRVQQLWERLLGRTNMEVKSLPQEYMLRLLEQSKVASLAELIDKKKRYANLVIQATNDLFDPLNMSKEDVDQWHEAAVKWSDEADPEIP